tara:strand:- start:6991 stop:8667 length:1677 start_codon:yes stop_codon:yes gene_type:complete
MSIKICLAETKKELDIIYSSISIRNKILCLPLNLETYLFCLNKKIDFINPIDFIDNEFHKKILKEGENFVKSINFKNNISETTILEIKSILRFRFYSVIFLSELLKKILKKYKTNSLVISGNNSLNHLPNSFLANDIVSNIFSNIDIEKINEFTDNNYDKQNYSYEINIKTNDNKKNILLNSLGYNFKRIIFSKIFNTKYNFYVFEENKISKLKKLLFKLLKIKTIDLKKKNDNSQKNIIIKNIDYKFADPNIKKTIFLLIDKLENYFSDFYKKKNAIEIFLKTNNFSLILTSMVRGIGGHITESINKSSCPSICISHGTVSEKFNEYDEIYKKIIASSVFSGSSKFFAIQSKITEKALNTHKIKGEKIITGNILFSENSNSNFLKSGKKILFAVTLKNFNNLQFLGVEMYYEFIKNLDLLNQLSQEKKINIIVKLHPSESKCIDYLKNQYNNLTFTNKPVEKLLKKCFVTISFSSTVIEDSLNSRTPVILFDQWKRYIHCKSNNKSDKKALYYANTYKDLCESIDKILLSKDYNFDEFIFKSSSKENINKKIFSLIK